MDTIDGVMWVALGSVLGGTAGFLAVRICCAACRRDFPLGNNGRQCQRSISYRRTCGIGGRQRDLRGYQTVAVCRHRIPGATRPCLPLASRLCRSLATARCRSRLESGALGVSLPSCRHCRLCCRPTRVWVKGRSAMQDNVSPNPSEAKQVERSPLPRARRSIWRQKFWDTTGSYISVALGSIVGGVARYLVSVLFLSRSGMAFPGARCSST